MRPRVRSLSGIVISQTSSPGAPVVYGGSPAAFGDDAMRELEAVMQRAAGSYTVGF